jgi:glycosyltransferase involved in cell wall biosynthesis
VITNCDAGANRLRLERVPARKIAVVRNGLDIDAFPARRMNHAPRKVVVVANLRREKGHDLLIDAAADVLREFPDASFEFVGDGADRARLEAHTAARGLSKAIAFLGHRDDVVDRLAAADMFVLPSRSEACSNALLEAMAAGLPIVATTIGGNLEVIDDGSSGLLVPPSSEALATAIRRLMADPQASARFGEAARTAATTRYSFSRMVDGFESIYWSALAKRGLVRAAAPQLAAS